MKTDRTTTVSSFDIYHSTFLRHWSGIRHSSFSPWGIRLNSSFSPCLRRCGVDHLHGDGGADRVGQPELVHPVLRPVLRLVVLADLDQDRVPSGLEHRGGDVRVLLEALVVGFA